MKLIHIKNNTEYEIQGNDIFSCEITEYCDLISNEIASNSLTARIKVPIEKEFKKKDKIICINNDDNIMGYFYIEKAKIIDYLQYENYYVYELTANDIIWYLEDIEFLGAYYTNKSANGEELGRPLKTVLLNMFSNTGISLTIPTSIENDSIIGYIPAGNLRTALQYLCFTNNYIVNTARIDGIELTIEDLSTKNVIEYEDIFNTEIEVNDAVVGVSATAVTYLQPDEEKEPNILFEGKFYDYDLGETQQTITFEPHNFFNIENGTLIDATTCYAVIEANNGNDTVKLTGRPYIKTNISYTKGDRKNTKVISENTMINVFNINNLISNVYEYFNNTHTATIDCLYYGNIPGDRIAAKTKFGVVYGRISEQTTIITSSLQRVKMVVEGALLPPQEEYYTPNELRTNDNLGII